jgi:hypothetical protein
MFRLLQLSANFDREEMQVKICLYLLRKKIVLGRGKSLCELLQSYSFYGLGLTPLRPLASWQLAPRSKVTIKGTKLYKKCYNISAVLSVTERFCSGPCRNHGMESGMETLNQASL